MCDDTFVKATRIVKESLFGSGVMSDRVGYLDSDHAVRRGQP
jgi:hypothetical protein